ncbi:DUF4359 domain-containing protein [Fusibacter bizertensis]
MKMKLKVVLGFIILLGILLFVTNPTQDDFKHYINQEINDKISNSEIKSNTFLDKIVSEISAKIVSEIADVVYNRSNYGFFSYYEIEGTGFDYKYVGIMGTFIRVSAKEE